MGRFLVEFRQRILSVSVIFNQPGGIAPKLRPASLPAPFSQRCLGIDLRSGKWTPRRGDKVVCACSAAAKGFYRHGGKIYQTDGESECAQVRIAQPDGEVEERTYITEAGAALQVRIDEEAAANVGAPKPPVAPILNVTRSVNDRANQPAIPIGIAYSLMLADGTESGLSPVAEFPEADNPARAGDQFSVSINYKTLTEKWPVYAGAGGVKILVYMATAPGVFRRITKRPATLDSSGADVILTAPAEGVDLVDAFPPEFSYTVAASAAGLNEAPEDGFIGAQKEFVLEGESDTHPREGMRHIGLHPNRFLFASFKNLLCFSAVEQYGVWPRDYEIAVPEGEIVNVKEHNGALWILPAGSPPRLLALDRPGPSGAQARTTESRYPCVDGRTLVNMGGGGLWYASRDGIVGLPSGQLLTSAILDSEYLGGETDLNLPSIAWADGDEYIFQDGRDRRFVLTPRSPRGGLELGELFAPPVKAKCEGAPKSYLLGENGDVCEVGGGEKSGRMVWRSRRVFFADRSSPAKVRVVAGGVDARTSFLFRPRAYNSPPLNAGAAGRAFAKESDFSAHQPIIVFGAARVVPEGKVIVRVFGSEENDDDPKLLGEAEFSPLKPADERLLGDILTPQLYDASGALASRIAVSWMELEVEALEGREVKFMVVDAQSGALKLLENAPSDREV